MPVGGSTAGRKKGRQKAAFEMRAFAKGAVAKGAVAKGTFAKGAVAQRSFPKGAVASAALQRALAAAMEGGVQGQGQQPVRYELAFLAFLGFFNVVSLGHSKRT